MLRIRFRFVPLAALSIIALCSPLMLAANTISVTPAPPETVAVALSLPGFIGDKLVGIGTATVTHILDDKNHNNWWYDITVQAISVDPAPSGIIMLRLQYDGGAWHELVGPDGTLQNARTLQSILFKNANAGVPVTKVVTFEATTFADGSVIAGDYVFEVTYTITDPYK